MKVTVVASQKSTRSSQPFRSASKADVPVSSVKKWSAMGGLIDCPSRKKQASAYPRSGCADASSFPKDEEWCSHRTRRQGCIGKIIRKVVERVRSVKY